jgi:hypothetical protein
MFKMAIFHKYSIVKILILFYKTAVLTPCLCKKYSIFIKFNLNSF